jgi:hypothetical protein
MVKSLVKPGRMCNLKSAMNSMGRNKICDVIIKMMNYIE